MKVWIFAVFVAAFWPTTSLAAEISQPLSGLSFLIGEWDATQGVVADTGGASSGHSSFTIEADGALLLRRDRTDLFDKSGKPTGSFHQVMTIYAENGTLHADYVDPQHIIHYDRVVVVPGRSAIFTSVAQPGVPQFRLTYLKTDPHKLSVTFAMAMPGRSDFHPIASGTITKAP